MEKFENLLKVTCEGLETDDLLIVQYHCELKFTGRGHRAVVLSDIDSVKFKKQSNSIITDKYEIIKSNKNHYLLTSFVRTCTLEENKLTCE